MTENEDSDNEEPGLRERLTKQFEGLSDEEFLVELQQTYEAGRGMSVAQYYELDRRRENGLDIASYSTDLAQSVADEDAKVKETMASVAESMNSSFTDIQLPTFDFELPAIPHFEDHSPIDLEAFMVRDPNAGIVDALDDHNEKLEAIEKNTADTADAVVHRLKQVETQNTVLNEKLEAIEKNVADTADAVVHRLKQVETQNTVLKNRFAVATVLALLGLLIAITSVLLTLVIDPTAT